MNTLKAHIESIEPTPIKQLFYKPQRVHYKYSGFIYYLRLDVEGIEHPIYKLGFCIDVYRRIHTLFGGISDKKIKVKLVACYKFRKAFQANQYEATFHRIYSKSRFKSPTPLLPSGNSELYSHDILGLDKQLHQLE